MKPDELRLVPNTMPVLQNWGEDVWIADGSERPLRLCFTSHPNDCRQAWRRIVVGLTHRLRFHGKHSTHSQ